MEVGAAISKREMCNTSDCSYLRKWSICMKCGDFLFLAEKTGKTQAGSRMTGTYLSSVFLAQFLGCTYSSKS